MWTGAAFGLVRCSRNSQTSQIRRWSFFDGYHIKVGICIATVECQINKLPEVLEIPTNVIHIFPAYFRCTRLSSPKANNSIGGGDAKLQY